MRAKRSRADRVLTAIVAVVLVAAAVLAGVLIGWTTDAREPAFVAPAAATAPIAAAVLPASIRTELHGSGTLRVGAQIAPGLYQVGVDGSGVGCTWARLKANDGRPKSVITSHVVGRGSPDEVKIEVSDKYFDFGMTCVVVAR